MTADPPLVFHIGLSARRSNSLAWGDTQYAVCLGHALEAKGNRAEIFFRDETPALTGGHDVVLRIVGPHLDEPLAGVPNLLWIISPPNLAPRATLARFATVFAASQQLASTLVKAGIVAEYMPQATDTALFNPHAGAAESERYDIAFVGNLAARAPRRNIRHAIDLGFPVKVWGEGWEGAVPPDLIGGRRLEIDGLASVYARSRIVLNSHMPTMSGFGMMSNRTFDALACGAIVLSDQVPGFSDPGLPDLIQTATEDDFVAALRVALDRPGRSLAGRLAMAASVGLRYGFAARADRFIDVARDHLRAGRRALPAYCPLDPRPAAGMPMSLRISDSGTEPGFEGIQTGASLDALLREHALDVTLHLSDATDVPSGLSGEANMRNAALAVIRIGAVLERRGRYAGFTVEPARSEARKGVIHPMMTDHLEAQAVALASARGSDSPVLHAEMLRLTSRARRLLEALGEGPTQFGARPHFGNRPEFLVRVINNRPLFAHSPEGYSRDKEKPHLILWPRAKPPVTERAVGVFLHLYYTDAAPVFAERLGRIAVPHRVYISTDTQAKMRLLASAFPQAEIRVLPNRGRDVCPKLFGFGDRHEDHDLVLHLHGKKSVHSTALESWLELALDCLLPPEPEINRILSLFQSVPALGIVAPLTHRAVLGAAHWGDNREMAQEVMRRAGIDRPLPNDDALRFPVGSMFWARRALLQPLLDLALEPDHFPPEEGQVDATLAHAFERLYGVICAAQGAHLIRVAPQGSIRHRAHQLRCNRNGDLREALDKGLLGG